MMINLDDESELKILDLKEHVFCSLKAQFSFI